MISTSITDSNHQSFKQNQRFFDLTDELRGLLMAINGYENMPLVSLEESVVPLMHILPNVNTYVFMAKNNSLTPPVERLTLDQSASICLYSIEWLPHDQCLYRALNSTLRSKDRQKLIPWYLYLKLILTALAYLPSIGDRLIYRGVKLDLNQDYSQEKKFIWWGFSSCTGTLSVLESVQFIGKTGVRTMFVIECPSAKDISKHTFFQSEQEVLILPATRFTVISCKHQPNGLHMVHLKEIPPPFVLLEPIILSKSSFSVASDTLSNTKSGPLVAKLSEHRRWSLDGTSTHSNPKLDKLISAHEHSSSMNLIQEQILDDDIPMIIEQASINKQCTVLDLTGNEITSEGAALLATALNTNSPLKELILYNNRLGDKGVRSLASQLALKTSNLKRLNLGLNNVTDDGAEDLAQMLKTNQTLTHLWLAENQIGDRGLQLLAGVLARQNWTLELLTLFSNKFSNDSSVTALIDMLRVNQSLQKLNIEHCDLTDRSEVKLQEFIKSKEHFELIM